MTSVDTRLTFSTADLCDAFTSGLQVLTSIFPAFGGNTSFAGEIYTVRVHDDNALVREILGRPGRQRVLVVAGRGAESQALVGDKLGALAVANGWVGIVVDGAVRDTRLLATFPLGIRARRAFPARVRGGDPGEEGQPVDFGGVTFRPGAWLYADEDGIVVADRNILD